MIIYLLTRLGFLLGLYSFNFQVGLNPDLSSKDTVGWVTVKEGRTRKRLYFTSNRRYLLKYLDRHLKFELLRQFRKMGLEPSSVGLSGPKYRCFTVGSLPECLRKDYHALPY